MCWLLINCPCWLSSNSIQEHHIEWSSAISALNRFPICELFLKLSLIDKFWVLNKIKSFKFQPLSPFPWNPYHHRRRDNVYKSSWVVWSRIKVSPSYLSLVVVFVPLQPRVIRCVMYYHHYLQPDHPYHYLILVSDDHRHQNNPCIILSLCLFVCLL